MTVEEWMRLASWVRLAVIGAGLSAASAQAAVQVYTLESGLLTARSDLTKSSPTANQPIQSHADGSFSTVLGRATITSATDLDIRACSYPTCLMSSIMSDAAAAQACSDANIGPSDPLYSTCLDDVRYAEQPTPTSVAVGSSAIGLLVDIYHAHGNATVDYVVNGEQGSTTFNRYGFIGFSGDQPLDIKLTSSATLFIRAVYTGASISAVPEPATWAMMLMGFGMVGASSRYRRKAAGVTYA